MRLDIPRPLITQSWSNGGKTEMFSPARTRTDNTSAHSRMCYQLSHPGFVCTTTLLTVVNVESRCLSASTLILSISQMMNCLKGTTLGWKVFLSYCKRWLFRRDPPTDRIPSHRSMPFFLRCGFTLLDLSTTLSAIL